MMRKIGIWIQLQNLGSSIKRVFVKEILQQPERVKVVAKEKVVPIVQQKGKRIAAEKIEAKMELLLERKKLWKIEKPERERIRLRKYVRRYRARRAIERERRRYRLDLAGRKRKLDKRVTKRGWHGGWQVETCDHSPPCMPDEGVWKNRGEYLTMHYKPKPTVESLRRAKESWYDERGGARTRDFFIIWKN